MEKVCEMRETLECFLKAKMDEGVRTLNTHETGMVVDMIKDLADAEEKITQAKYYKTVTEAMEEAGDEEKGASKYYTTMMVPMDHNGGMYDREASNGMHSMPTNNTGRMTGSNERTMTPYSRKYNEGGRVEMARKMYTEHKEMHPDDTSTEKVKHLTSEITDELADIVASTHMTGQEKAALKSGLVSWANKL